MAVCAQRSFLRQSHSTLFCSHSATSPYSAANSLVPVSRSRSVRRFFHASPVSRSSASIPDYAFAFDIDGVLLRASRPLPHASKALSYLQSHRVPFILLTNGGGTHESTRVANLSSLLSVPLSESLFIQSHTPFAEHAEGPLRDQPILVVGGDGDNCRLAAEAYGFRHVITPGDILAADPTIWPFSTPFLPYHRSYARPLPKSPSPLRIAAIFVFNDPRDWGLDAHIILDLLLSSQGVLGTRSPRNNDPVLPNRGFQQDGQPPLFFSNPDLWWAAAHPLPRLGQGGFRAALEGVWKAATGGAELNMEVIGKPHQSTYAFAERKLRAHRAELVFASGGGGEQNIGALRKVYFVGDNPASDICGANTYSSEWGSTWDSILVRTGVWREEDGEPAWAPKTIVGDVWDAVRWGLKREGVNVEA